MRGSVGFFILGTHSGLEGLDIFCTEGSAAFCYLGTDAVSGNWGQ